MGRTVRIGKVMITPEGKWTSGKEYERLSLVYWDGNGYVSIKKNTDVEPGTDEDIWMLCVLGHSPVLTTDSEGNLYVDGELASEAIPEALERVDEALQQIADAIERAGQAGLYTFDEAPVRNSQNPVKSGGIYSALLGKVDNVPGKNLSTNDYTNADKDKLSGIEAGAQKNVKSDWNAASGDAQILNKPDLSAFITKTVNDLTNYYTKSQTFTKEEVQSLIAGIRSFTYELVSVLPTASASTLGAIYLVPSSDPQTQNVKDEYITIQESGSYSWEQIGSTAIDLSGYVTTAALNTALANYVTTTAFQTALANKVGSETIDSIVELSQAEYDALATKDPGVMYIVTDPEEAPEGYISIADISTESSSAPGGQNVTTITLSNGTTQQIVTKNGLNGADGADGQPGPQGNSGFTPGEGAIELVNNLYQGGETSFLSAEQGKILNDKLYYPCEGNTLATALLEVDANYRTPGRVIRFQDETGKYRNYKYMGKYYTELDWTTETSWLDIDNADKFKVWYFLESPDLSNYTLGSFNSSGALVSGNYKITDFIEIPEGGLPIGGSWYRRYVLYDTDKETIKSTALLYGGKTFNQTQGAYVRFEFENYNLNWNYGYRKGTASNPGRQYPHVRVFPAWDMLVDYANPVNWLGGNSAGNGETGLIPVTKGEVISKLFMFGDNTGAVSAGRTMNFRKYDTEGNLINSTATSITAGNFVVTWDGYIAFNGPRDICFRTDINDETQVAIVRGIERSYKNSKKWLILGDSISAHSSSLASQGYGWLIGNEHNICVVNRAVGGHASASTINVVNGIDFSPYDVCTIAIGTNDLNYNILASAFETNLHTIIDTIQAAKPTIKIGIFNLFRRAQYPTDETKNPSSNATFGQYEDTIKKVANEYGIPMLDVEHECQANFRIATYADNYSTNGDGLHPNNEAHKLFVYPLVKQFLEKLLG